MGRSAFAIFAALLGLAPAVGAQARAPRSAQGPVRARDRVYIVRPGDSVQRIATQLEVPVRELTAINSIAPPYRLAVGRRLRLPEGVPEETLRTLPTRDESARDDDGNVHRAGVVTMVRARDGAETTANFNASGPALRRRVERWMQSRDGAVHIVHPRLLRVFPMLSSRFGGRTITVVSGFRPHRGSSDAPRNRHALGYAVDLRVEGIPLRAVWEFCQTIHGMGCGLSTRGNFVHVDVRTTDEAWLVGGRGEPVPLEETARDVADDARPRD